MRMLLALDGSPHSQDAVDEVVQRPWPAGTTACVLTVIQPYVPPATEFALGSDTLDELRQQQRDEAGQITARAAGALADAGLIVQTLVREGDPRSAILEEAESWQADLIVMGSQGLTGWKRWLLGSVAQAIVAHAPCSVLVVRHPARTDRA